MNSDLFNYATTTNVDTSNLAPKSDLASLKAKEIDKIDIDNLETVPADLSNLSNVVDNYIVIKRCTINWLHCTKNEVFH